MKMMQVKFRRRRKEANEGEEGCEQLVEMEAAVVLKQLLTKRKYFV